MASLIATNRAPMRMPTMSVVRYRSGVGRCSRISHSSCRVGSSPARTSSSAAGCLRRVDSKRRPSIVNSTGLLMSMTLSLVPIAILSRVCHPQRAVHPPVADADPSESDRGIFLRVTFERPLGRDNRIEMMRELAVAVGMRHPLVDDRARLDKITDNMYAQIHRDLHGAGRDPRAERILHGGQSADDVLQEALIALLEYDAGKLRTTWEALSVGIARKKAFAALRRATRGRRAGSAGRGDPDDVTVIPLDATLIDPRDETADPELAFEHTQQQLVLLRLAARIL